MNACQHTFKSVMMVQLLLHLVNPCPRSDQKVLYSLRSFQPLDGACARAQLIQSVPILERKRSHHMQAAFQQIYLNVNNINNIYI